MSLPSVSASPSQPCRSLLFPLQQEGRIYLLRHLTCEMIPRAARQYLKGFIKINLGIWTCVSNPESNIMRTSFIDGSRIRTHTWVFMLSSKERYLSICWWSARTKFSHFLILQRLNQTLELNSLCSTPVSNLLYSCVSLDTLCNFSMPPFLYLDHEGHDNIYLESGHRGLQESVLKALRI